MPQESLCYVHTTTKCNLLPVCILICICCELLEPNVFPHSLQGNCLPDTLLWLCLWFINDLPSGNSSPQTSHVTTLFLCDSMCLFNLALLWKVLEHFVQANIFSLVCSQLCFNNVRRSLHALPHNMQVFGGRFLPCFAWKKIILWYLVRIVNQNNGNIIDCNRIWYLRIFG